MTTRPLAIRGSGMMTAVGLTAPATCAAIRCGINNFQETRFMDGSGEWIVGSEVPLEQPWRGPAKLARMLAAVIEESFATEPALRVDQTPVIVCLAERERPGRHENLKERLMGELSGKLRLHEDSRLISQGRVGGVVALRDARSLLYEQGHRAVLIAGVDSYLVGPTLGAYEERRRLLTAANSDGFIPGEGAAAVTVSRPVPSSEPQLTVVGLGFAVETAAVESEEPLRADGLVEAIRGALAEANAAMGALDFRITDVSGEQYGFKEAALALTRLLRVRKEEFDIWHPADCIGEVGAAAGPAVFNVAWSAAEKAYAKGANILCHFGNDDGKRAAAILTYQPVRATEGPGSGPETFPSDRRTSVGHKVHKRSNVLGHLPESFHAIAPHPPPFAVVREREQSMSVAASNLCCNSSGGYGICNPTVPCHLADNDGRRAAMIIRHMAGRVA